MKNPKEKGNSFEREVYKLLRERFGQEAVSRNLGSGSSDETADITLHWNGNKYSIECKAYGKLTWGEISKMWTKLVHECDNKKFSGTPILVMKFNRQRDWEVAHTASGTDILIRYKFSDWLRTL